MAPWRFAEPSSAGCLDLAECVRTNRKTLAPNQKQLSAEVRRRAVVSEVGATGRLWSFLSMAPGPGRSIYGVLLAKNPRLKVRRWHEGLRRIEPDHGLQLS